MAFAFGWSGCFLEKVHSAINAIHFPIFNLPNLGRAKLETCPESRRLGFLILGEEDEAKPINIPLSLIAKVSDGLHDGLWRSKIRYKHPSAVKAHSASSLSSVVRKTTWRPPKVVGSKRTSMLPSRKDK
ncbi:hypothetical protein FNV43_RR19105 [Rhamnella rubrinervis]|uniref:Uncharacterized protein n=1 Tax=Rhamnella rubrinervis TaxID=2594499 RepID=A0A8K0E7A2_9ROSA|nr:hypothetical protein FNV43_RR19105 [Rhamnella rubrinervis]